jgi:hypothetical protein
MKRISTILISLWCLTVLCTPEGNAQSYRKKMKNRFTAGALLGLNLSQIDGDKYRGYDKINPALGITGTAFLTKKAELRVELLYLEKGSRTESESRTEDEKDRKIHLAYMEVPFLFRYRFAEDDVHSFLEGGFSFARMINSRVTEPAAPGDGYLFQPLEEDFNRNEFNVLLGAGLQFNKHLSFKLRYGFAISRFYDDEGGLEEPPLIFNKPRNIDFLRNYYLMFALQYDL